MLYLYRRPAGVDDLGSLWWELNPRVAINMYAWYKSTITEPDYSLGTPGHPDKVYFDQTANSCIIDGHGIFASKLFHSVYDEVFRGIEACCLFSGGDTSFSKFIIHLDGRQPLRDVAAAFCARQQIPKGYVVRDGYELEFATAHANHKVALHEANNISVPVIAWNHVQNKRSPAHWSSQCAVEHLRTIFTNAASGGSIGTALDRVGRLVWLHCSAVC